MNYGRLISLLDATLVKPIAGPPSGVVLAGGPLDLNEVVPRLAESEEEDRLEEEDPYSILQEDLRFEPLVSFEWLAFGPMASGKSLNLLSFPDVSRAYLVIDSDNEFDETWPVVASIEPRDSPEVHEALFASLLQDNGAQYGIHLFGTLPSPTMTHAPKLLSRRVVESSYVAWMDWAERSGRTTWDALLREFEGRLDEPDHLARSSALLDEVVGRLREGRFEREKKSRTITTPEQKELLMKAYLDLSYGESSK
jgi:hypothetical protein